MSMMIELSYLGDLYHLNWSNYFIFLFYFYVSDNSVVASASLPLKCPLGSKACRDGKECVLYSHVCDGEKDCKDGSDERNCERKCKKGTLCSRNTINSLSICSVLLSFTYFNNSTLQANSNALMAGSV